MRCSLSLIFNYGENLRVPYQVCDDFSSTEIVLFNQSMKAADFPIYVVGIGCDPKAGRGKKDNGKLHAMQLNR